MRLLVLALALAVSGCFGIPPGSADFGDEVTIRYVALDAETGEPLAWAFQDNVRPQDVRAAAQARLGEVPGYLEPLIGGDAVDVDALVDALREAGDLAAFGQRHSFVLGESGLGFATDRELVGRQPNETFRFVSDDPTRGYTETVTVPRFLDPQGIEQSLARSQFEQALGPAEVGQTFQYNLLQDAEVIEVTNTTVRFRVLAEEGQSAPADVVGATLVTRVADETFRYELVPDVGARFTISPPPPNNPQTPLGLEPGAYEVRGTEGDDIVYGYAAGPPQLAGRTVEFHIEVLSVARVPEEPVTSNYGERRSPVLPPSDHEHGEPDDHDDGHDDHQH